MVSFTCCVLKTVTFSCEAHLGPAWSYSESRQGIQTKTNYAWAFWERQKTSLTKKMWFHIQERPTYGHDTELDKGKHPFLNFNVLSQIQIFWSSFMNPRSLLVFGSIGLVYIYLKQYNPLFFTLRILAHCATIDPPSPLFFSFHPTYATVSQMSLELKSAHTRHATTKRQMQQLQREGSEWPTPIKNNCKGFFEVSDVPAC